MGHMLSPPRQSERDCSSISIKACLEACLPSFSRKISPLEAPKSISVDSRTVFPGDLFIALPGAGTDGHCFLREAVHKGASALIVRRDFQGEVPSEVPVERVEDTLECLQSLAKQKMRMASPRVIAITGSVGKTTTKEFVNTLLASERRVFCTAGNMNSQIGLCLSILNGSRGDEEWYVLEMGMTHKGNIQRLVEIAPPDIAVVTSIHLVHAQNFSGLSDIAEAKSEIFSSPDLSLRLINRDSHAFATLVQSSSAPYKTFSISGHGDAHWTISRRGLQCDLYEMGRLQRTISDPCFPAAHVYDNLLAAVSVARSAGISWDGIEEGVKKLALPKQRLEESEAQGIVFINDSYNASEPSMLSALDVLQSAYLRKGKRGRKIAVLGQMRELGQFSKECHERVGLKAIEVSDAVFCLGEEALPIRDLCHAHGKPHFWTVSLEELLQELQSTLKAEDCVLLKGSRSNQLWRILDHFSCAGTP